jgi:ribose-phosphate pyrophosphokinase
VNALVFSVPGNEAAAEALAAELDSKAGRAEVRQFPDGEWYVRIDSEVSGREALVVASLDHPDWRVLAAYFVAATARDLGASQVGLVAPYLAYMRQDRRFRPGEGVTSAYFGRLISGAFDWLVTVDPHLDRRASLGEIYSIPTRVVHAAPLIAAWVM